MKKIDKIKNFYEKHKVKLIITLVAFVILSLALQLYLLHREKLNEEDIIFKDLSWSKFCDEQVYTEQDRIDFCNNCSDEGGDACVWPLDMTIVIERVDNIIRTGGEVHCYLVINGVNYYYEKGKYYGVFNQTLFTWDLLDASRGHHVEVCCGIERYSPIATLVGLEKKWPQACVEKEVEPRCIIN